MAQIKLHGNKALIIQTFNTIPNILLEEYSDVKTIEKRKATNYIKRVFKNNNIGV